MSLRKGKFDADAFRKQIKQILFAIPENAYALMQSTGDSLRLVATDGFVLAVSVVKTHLGRFEICLTRKMLEDVLRGKDVGEDDFSLPELKQLAVKQSDFPNFESVLQRLKRDGPKVTVQAPDLLSSLRSIIPCGSDDRSSARVYFTMAPDGLHLDKESYWAEDTIDAVIRKNDYRTIRLDAERLIPFLNHIDGCVSIYISERLGYPPSLEFVAGDFRCVVSAMVHRTSVSDEFPKDEPLFIREEPQDEGGDKTAEDLQPRIFDEPWKREWKGMPEFVQQEVEPYAVITIRFAEPTDIADFGRRLGHPSIDDIVRINRTGETGGAYKPIESDSVPLGFPEPWEKEWQDMPEFDQKHAKATGAKRHHLQLRHRG